MLTFTARSDSISTGSSPLRRTLPASLLVGSRFLKLSASFLAAFMVSLRPFASGRLMGILHECMKESTSAWVTQRMNAWMCEMNVCMHAWVYGRMHDNRKVRQKEGGREGKLREGGQEEGRKSKGGANDVCERVYRQKIHKPGNLYTAAS